MNDRPVCVVSICKGRCCEEITEMFVRKSEIAISLVGVADGLFRCLNHDKGTGRCMAYADRPIPCKLFFCEAAERGYMRAALEAMEAERMGLHVRMEGGFPLVREVVLNLKEVGGNVKENCEA